MFKLSRFNIPLLLLPIFLFCIGFMTLLSVYPEKANSQLAYFIFGFVLYFAIALIDFHIFKYYWKYLYFLIVVLLLVLLVISKPQLGAVRWFDLGILNAQPSEFAKIILVISIAAIISTKPNIFRDNREFFRLLGYFAVLFTLIVIQPDLGTSIVLLATFVGMLFYAGLDFIYFFMGFIIFGLVSSPLWNLLHDYQKDRILVLVNPMLDTTGAGYNVIQSIIAIGSGGIMGKGFGNGTQSHLNFLPAFWTDFIFASMAEEWGFLGVLAVVFFFGALLIALLYVSFKLQDAYSSLTCIGVFMVFFSQFFINVGMNLGVLPVTGVTLPFISYGGSSILTSMILLGLVQGVWVRR